jgi:hypothetical protein
MAGAHVLPSGVSVLWGAFPRAITCWRKIALETDEQAALAVGNRGYPEHMRGRYRNPSA